jgi:hypothetical protein
MPAKPVRYPSVAQIANFIRAKVGVAIAFDSRRGGFSRRPAQFRRLKPPLLKHLGSNAMALQAH